MGITGAWLAAAWSRSKRMPPLEQALKRASGESAVVYESKDDAKADIDRMAEELAPGQPTMDKLKA